MDSFIIAGAALVAVAGIIAFILNVAVILEATHELEQGPEHTRD